MPTAVVTLHVTGMNGVWGFPQFLHLRVLDITLGDWEEAMSKKDVLRRFHSIMASLTSPALEHVRLELWAIYSISLSMQDMDSREATTDAYRAQYADLHAVLARPTFSSLHRVMVVLYDAHGKRLVPAKDVVLKWLDFLRALFAPWCVRGITNLACIARVWASNCVDAIAADKGEVPCFFDLRGQGYNVDTALQVVGFDASRRWPGW